MAITKKAMHEGDHDNETFEQVASKAQDEGGWRDFNPGGDGYPRTHDPISGKHRGETFQDPISGRWHDR